MHSVLKITLIMCLMLLPLHSWPEERPDSSLIRATTKQLGSDDRPLIVKVSPSQSDKETEAQLVYWTRVLALLAALQFIALGVHAVFFGLQARALRDTIVQSKDSEKRELRAYAGVASAHIILPERGGMMNVYVEIQNFGRTPAYNASSAVYYDIRNLAAPPPEFFIAAGDDRASTSTVYPGRSLELKIDKVVSVEAADAAYRGQNQIIVWGQVDYEDVFGKPHWTRFRLMAYRVPGQERFILAGMKNENAET